MLSNLSATVLFVNDLEACKVFYEEIFGLKALFSDDHSVAYKMEAHDFVLLKISAAVDMIGEEALTFDKSVGHRIMLCVGVDNVDTTYEKLKAKGLTFIKAPKSQDWGRRTAYFADPEGNIWELWHHLDEES